MKDEIMSKYKNKRSESSARWSRNNPEKRKATTKLWNQNNPERRKIIRNRHKWKKLEMDPDIAQTVYESSDNCVICGVHVEGKNKHLDHNHENKKVRDILCYRCNTVIGLAEEDIKLLNKAKAYLIKHL